MDVFIYVSSFLFHYSNLCLFINVKVRDLFQIIDSEKYRFYLFRRLLIYLVYKSVILNEFPN